MKHYETARKAAQWMEGHCYLALPPNGDRWWCSSHGSRWSAGTVCNQMADLIGIAEQAIENYANAARQEERARLRAQVEALNGILTAKFDDGQDVLLWRSEVIALLKEDDRE